MISLDLANSILRNSGEMGGMRGIGGIGGMGGIEGMGGIGFISFIFFYLNCILHSYESQHQYQH